MFFVTWLLFYPDDTIFDKMEFDILGGLPSRDKSLDGALKHACS